MTESFEYDPHMHNLILFQVAYDLTLTGNNVKVDYSNGKNGHLLIDSTEGLLLIKALPENKAFPVTPEEISNMVNFRYALLCFLGGNGRIEIYHISVDAILSILRDWKIGDPNEVQWISPQEYMQFKSDYFIM